MNYKVHKMDTRHISAQPTMAMVAIFAWLKGDCHTMLVSTRGFCTTT